MDSSHVRRMAEIGIALSAEKDLDKILEMIVDETRSLTRADGGTLYIVDEEKRELRFEILQNTTLGIRRGGTSGQPVSLPPVPLEVEDRPNHANVSSHVALTRETVNIPDIYQAQGFDFSGTRSYDSSTGYRSRSILVIPMLDHEETVIGVLQLLNALDAETGEVLPFPDEQVPLIASLASQAAVALTNRKLIDDLSRLFDAFVKSIAAGIDEKSPFTGGHIRRVSKLTMMIADAVNATGEGPLAGVHFSEDELEELRIAAWMHDVGKIALPEHLVSKGSKLETPYDRIGLVETRFDLIRQTLVCEYLTQRLELLEEGVSEEAQEELGEALERELAELAEEKEFLRRLNRPSQQVSDADIARLGKIAAKSYTLDGRQHPYLSPDEVHHLSVRYGTLTAEERRTIENHATTSIRMLNQLPFPRKLLHVPQYAGGHHEKLDGSGYPLGLTAEELPLQARIIAIADIFEALTAPDRPYKEPMSLSRALEILEEMKRKNHIDADLFDLLARSDVCRRYAEEELQKEPDQ